MLLRSRPLFKQFPAPLKVRASPGRSGGEGPWRPYPPPRFSPPLPVSLAPTLSYLSQCLSVRLFVCASGLASLFFCSFSPGTVSPTSFLPPRHLPARPASPSPLRVPFSLPSPSLPIIFQPPVPFWLLCAVFFDRDDLEMVGGGRTHPLCPETRAPVFWEKGLGFGAKC